MEPLAVLHHVPKTAGTSLRQVVSANYGQRGLVDLDRVASGAVQFYDREKLDGTARQCRDFYAGLAADRRAELRCVMGHGAPFLIAAVEDRPVRAFCMLRDPVGLVLSFYRFMVWWADNRGATGLEVRIVEAMRERGWSLADVYRELGGGRPDDSELHRLFTPMFNVQARHLLMATTDSSEIGFARGSAALADHRDRAARVLGERYVVGTQDHFSQSVRLFAEAFGWRRSFVPRANVGRVGDAEMDAETRALIRSYNTVDAELHERYSLRLAALPPVRKVDDARAKVGIRVRRGASMLRRRAGRRLKLQV